MRSYLMKLDLMQHLRLIRLALLGVLLVCPACGEGPSTRPNSPSFYRTLDHVLADSSTLRQLYMTEIGDSLDPRIGAFSQLEYLEIRNSDLLYLPDEFATLKRLWTLKLIHNNFKSIPPQIFELSRLSGLLMYGNNIDSIPFGLQRLTNLDFLSLDDNRLRHIAIANINPRKMVIMEFANNRLDDFPADSSDFPKLQYLVLTDNPIPDSTKKAIRRRLPNVDIAF